MKFVEYGLVLLAIAASMDAIYLINQISRVIH